MHVLIRATDSKVPAGAGRTMTLVGQFPSRFIGMATTPQISMQKAVTIQFFIYPHLLFSAFHACNPPVTRRVCF